MGRAEALPIVVSNLVPPVLQLLGGSIQVKRQEVDQWSYRVSVSKFVGTLKGKSALMFFDKHPELKDKYNRHFWAVGYFVSTVGDVNEATITEYIKNQEEADKNS